MKRFLGAALFGAALLLPGCAPENTDATAVTVYKSPT